MKLAHASTFALVWVLGLGMAGCGASSQATEQRLQDMARKVSELQTDQTKLLQRVAVLEVRAARHATSTRTLGDASTDRPPLDVVHLSPDDGSESNGATSPAGDAKDPPTVIRLEGKRVPSVHRGAEGTSDTAMSRGSAEYEDAFELVKKKRYDDALEAFAGFLVRHPGHPHADNAMYWRGECFYAKGDYVRAVEQFEGLLARFPQGDKVPDAMLKLGLSQKHMGEGQKAKETFTLLQRQHPNSDAAKRIPE